MLSFIWKERDRQREKGDLFRSVLENNCSKNFLKVFYSKFRGEVKLQAEIWKPITLLKSTKHDFPGYFPKYKLFGHTPPFSFPYHSVKYPKFSQFLTSVKLLMGTVNRTGVIISQKDIAKEDMNFPK